MNLRSIALLTLVIGTGSVFVTSAQDAGGEGVAFGDVGNSLQKQLEESISELDELRKRVAVETLPLSRALSQLEADLVEVRLEYQQASRVLDSRTLDLSNLRTEIKSRKEEKTYLSNLLGEYVRNFESRLHIAEIQRYRETLETAKLAPENTGLSEEEVYKAQTGLVAVSLERLEEALSGGRFKGSAVDSTGLVKSGTFVMVGPTAIFLSEDGQTVGTAETRLGSLEPTIVEFEGAEDSAAAAATIKGTGATFPLDPTLGNAHKIEATKEELVEHIKKGGVVMYPILGLAAAAMLVALFKWLMMLFLRSPSRKRVRALLDSIARKDRQGAEEAAARVGGPTGKMLRAGVENLDQPSDLIEEVMYERILTTRLSVQRLLPFIAISAASAPLLGLLGTVTGIINTFKLITVFGSGDVKTLSGGISEALITTEFGLIVAIPSLLLHAFLSRKAKGVVDNMEKTAVSFMNEVNRSQTGSDGSGPSTPAKTENKAEKKATEEAAPVLTKAPAGAGA